MPTITIDPITRIEGHLRIDVNIDGGRVNDAWASCTMWRGIENILLGRDSREAWLFTQRFCGVCTTVHAMASVRAVENALQMEIPLNAQYIRNLILIAHGLHDHIVHFYHLSALDWVDVTQVLKADPKKAANVAQSLSDWPGNSVKELTLVKERVAKLVASGQLGIFKHGYWGHPAMRLDPETNLIAVTHYFQALDAQRKINEVVGMLGGKTPHIQNLAVGGVMNAINLDGQGAMNMDHLYRIKERLEGVRPFIEQVYFPDVCLVGSAYADWFGIGKGVDHYLAVPDLPTDTTGKQCDLPGGTVRGDALDKMDPITTFSDARLRESVTEDSTHAYYEGGGPLHPFKGETKPAAGEWEPDGKYTWVKAPRFADEPTQVGPLAQVLVGYMGGHELTRKHTDGAFDLIKAISGKQLQLGALRSTMGRHLARAIRTRILLDLGMKHWSALANNVLGGDVSSFNRPDFPETAVEGVGMHEAPRGTLTHWVVARGGKIDNYQAVVPTTWNASPRDEKGRPGPYEASLLNTPVADPKLPLEVIRTVHSFDPCMACACHAFDPNGNELAKVKVL